MAFDVVTFKYCFSASDIIRNSLKVAKTSFKADGEKLANIRSSYEACPHFSIFVLTILNRKK